MAKIEINTQLVEQLVSDYSDMVFRIAYQYTFNSAEAEDILQDVFLKLIRQKEFNCYEHIKPWLIRVTINKCHDYNKSAKSKNQPLDENLQEELHFEETFVEENLIDEVNSLTDFERDTTYLFYYEDYSAQEIAELLDKSTNSIYIALNKARKKMKTYLLSEEGNFNE